MYLHQHENNDLYTCQTIIPTLKLSNREDELVICHCRREFIFVKPSIKTHKTIKVF